MSPRDAAFHVRITLESILRKQVEYSRTHRIADELAALAERCKGELSLQELAAIAAEDAVWAAIPSYFTNGQIAFLSLLRETHENPPETEDARSERLEALIGEVDALGRNVR